jgi:CHRD domain
MRRRNMLAVLAAIFIGEATSAQPAQAKILKFQADLDGQYGMEPTGSAAIGHAAIEVDTASRRVSVDLKVDGITIDSLWDKLVAAPIGPIHFHEYAAPGAASSVLALPLPFGSAYHATPGGLRVKMKSFDYAADAALVKSTLSFDDFVSAMKNGLIVLNVHTDKFNPGEISGLVVPD